ncbi:DsbA family protein [Cupriavidus pauculus]|uniref:DsbA family protein n=1 Tax=Cupriavidus pauculus TaxID=82633 RepID=A0A2N5CAC9_9BURK|nr:DsbA family protein [Cupriavidus pauculus]PLP99175.1 DsbA family protein [Cupriavidus pauculus]
MELIFIGDPMCSWCYGFGKEMTALQQRFPDIPVRIVVGGIRAGATDVLDEAGKRFRLQHWTRVETASGLPFNREAFRARQGFVYDTEPICRAVVTARRLAPQADLVAVFRALQHAFYVDGLDTTNGRVLAAVATDALALQQHDIDTAAFLADWGSQPAIDETAEDFRTARLWGVSSFPTLALRIDKKLYQVAGGYASADTVAEQIERTRAAVNAAAAATE